MEERGRNQIPYLGTCTEIKESGMYEEERYVDQNNNLNACGFVFEAPNNWSSSLIEQIVEKCNICGIGGVRK